MSHFQSSYRHQVIRASSGKYCGSQVSAYLFIHFEALTFKEEFRKYILNDIIEFDLP